PPSTISPLSLHDALPISGLAQIQLPPDTDLESVRRKIAYDVYYVAHLSPWLDVQVLFGTGFHVLGVPFRIVRRLLGLPGGATVEDRKSTRLNSSHLGISY